MKACPFAMASNQPRIDSSPSAVFTYVRTDATSGVCCRLLIESSPPTTVMCSPLFQTA